MNKICIATSTSFYVEAESLVKIFKRKGLDFYCSIRLDQDEERYGDISASRKTWLQQHFYEQLNNASHLYVIALAGYTGKNVSQEVAYAAGLKAAGQDIQIISSEDLKDPCLNMLVDKVISLDDMNQMTQSFE